MSDVNGPERTDEVREKVRKFILEHFPMARQQQPGDSDSLLDSGIVDSLGILEIVNFLSEGFEIEVSDEDLMPENFDSISTLSSFVMRKADRS